MEAEGALAAVFERPQIRGALVIRGICDMADERKADDWQEYAANAAAAFVVSFLKTEPVQPRVALQKSYPSTEQNKIFLSKLPTTGRELFGREDELKMLDNAWREPHTNILTLVAWGGVGKTALVNEWLNHMERDNYRGAERIYGWSFYSQGTREDRQASADEFLAHALGWFGDPDPRQGVPWDKGIRLAELIRQNKTLLILDGLEPLQYPPGEMHGFLEDQGMQALLKELPHSNPGLCVVTTRCQVKDIENTVGTSTTMHCLEYLSIEAGAELLKYLGVKGTDAELREATREFAGHALALNLLGSYLATVHGGEIRKRDLIPHLTEDEEHGGHARRVMRSYENWLSDKPELDILYLMGLFDRPAPGGAIEVLRAKPLIKGLTDKLQDLSEAKWQYAVKHLRDLRLLAEKDENNLNTLDCHPLIREHFGEKLKEKSPDAWKEAHSRLYEYYKSQAPELPNTLEEMTPLFAAVAHGCQADRHQEALNEVYYRRIQHDGYTNFCMRQLGAISADLAALSGFFNPPWRQPVGTLTEDDRAVVLNWAGFRLCALGRLEEATQPMQVGLENHLALEDWVNAAIDVGNLSELYLTSGNLTKALDYARQGVDFADRSASAFPRMGNRSIMANALHQAGRVEEAVAAFREAEEIQKMMQPVYPLLYSFQGFLYCDLLLTQGKYRKVQTRAEKALDIVMHGSRNLLDIALNHLSLGRAYLLQPSRREQVILPRLRPTWSRRWAACARQGSRMTCPAACWPGWSYIGL